MPVQKALSVAGFAKQSVKGTPIANPTFQVGLTDGAPLNVAVTQSPEQITLDASRLAPDVNRLSVIPGHVLKMRAYPASIGLLLLGALGGVVDSGSTNFTHTITPATALPYITGWGKFGGVVHSVQDCKVDDLELSWDGTGTLNTIATLLGTSATYAGTMTPGTDEQFSQPLRAAGGTFKVDVGSATAVTAKIIGGSVKISNKLEPIILSASVIPDDIFEGEMVITTTLKLKVADLTDWRKFVTGTGAGTTASQLAVFGSFDHTFINGANNSLELAALRVAFNGNFPDAAPAGGAAELTLTGDVVLQAAGATAFTATVKNQVATY